MTDRVRRFLLAVMWVMAVAIGASQVRGDEVSEKQMQNRRCLNCHGQSRMATLSPGDRAAMVAPSTNPSTQPARRGLHVASDALAGSVHKNLGCVDCHRDATKLPHAQKLEP